jgi:hypothetical protein
MLHEVLKVIFLELSHGAGSGRVDEAGTSGMLETWGLETAASQCPWSLMIDNLTPGSLCL